LRKKRIPEGSCHCSKSCPFSEHILAHSLYLSGSITGFAGTC
jgi:hypothetical protein